MTGVEELDFSEAGMTPDPLEDYRPRDERDPWLRRRTHAWGASELAPLLVAYGLAPLSSSQPAWVLNQAEHYKRLGLPKLVAWKAGLRARPKGDKASKKKGQDRERELFLRWRSTLAGRRVDPRKCRHADTVPREWFPLVDRHCPRIAVTPDAWARAHDGALVAVELKTTYKPMGTLAAPWHYRCQLQAQMAAMEAKHGLLVVGERWVAEHEADGPIRVFVVPRDQEHVQLLRVVAREAYDLVEELRATKDAKRVGALWEASRARLADYRPDDRAQLEDALAEIDIDYDGIANVA